MPAPERAKLRTFPSSFHKTLLQSSRREDRAPTLEIIFLYILKEQSAPSVTFLNTRFYTSPYKIFWLAGTEAQGQLIFSPVTTAHPA